MSDDNKEQDQKSTVSSASSTKSTKKSISSSLPAKKVLISRKPYSVSVELTDGETILLDAKGRVSIDSGRIDEKKLPAGVIIV